MDVCAGGTISTTTSSITFVNHHSQPCDLGSCKLPGWPKPDPWVPAEAKGVAGTLTLQLSPPIAKGDYPYKPDCCGKETDPVIKVQ
jgi:hypothetical protein